MVVDAGVGDTQDKSSSAAPAAVAPAKARLTVVEVQALELADVVGVGAVAGQLSRDRDVGEDEVETLRRPAV